ncbi:hypothetical protein D3C72_1443900 [compost metagenome]
MAASGTCIGQGEMTFEIHLPEQIRGGMFKTRRRDRILPDGCAQNNAPMAAQDGIDGAVMGEFGFKR